MTKQDDVQRLKQQKDTGTGTVTPGGENIGKKSIL